MDKAELLAAFRSALESEPPPRTEQPADAASEPRADLFSLFSELAALKSEIHLEARQFKGALERFGGIADGLQAERDSWNEQLARAREEALQQSRKALQPLLIELLDLRDRMDAGLQAAERYRPKRLALCSRRHEAKVIAALREGQELTLRRLENLLSAHDVHPIEVLDRVLDPQTMRAAEVDQRADKDDGVVTAELRRGFLWGDQVLRAAEVKVNRRQRKALSRSPSN